MIVVMTTHTRLNIPSGPKRRAREKRCCCCRGCDCCCCEEPSARCAGCAVQVCVGGVVMMMMMMMMTRDCQALRSGRELAHGTKDCPVGDAAAAAAATSAAAATATAAAAPPPPSNHNPISLAAVELLIAAHDVVENAKTVPFIHASPPPHP